MNKLYSQQAYNYARPDAGFPVAAVAISSNRFVMSVSRRPGSNELQIRQPAVVNCGHFPSDAE